ncbi:MAG TPA: fibronectin type III domain-containing protein, partial [Chloroflexota bacterium]|nr:fibronectin type III domain-containing protein [Chloroflexota bacterium]
MRILDVTFPSGQHLWFDRDLCRTFAWYDTDDATALASPIQTNTRWPVPDITVYRGYPSPYSDQLGGVWATDWGSAWQPHFQGYTTTATSVTFTCDHASVDGNDAAHRYTAQITYADAERPTGNGYSLQATITPPAGVSVDTWTQQTGVGAVGGSATGLVAWAFDGDGYGVTAFPWVGGLDTRDERSDGIHFWSILTHPQGTFVLEQPNLYDPAAFGDWHLFNNGWDQGFWVAKPTTGTTNGNAVTTDPLLFLWKREPGRAIPQRYLDARYALVREWLATLQLGPQHNPRAQEGAGGGGVTPFAQLGTIANYFNGATGAGDWYQRQAQLIAQVPMLHTTNGQPSGIDQQTNVLAPDYYLPNASDLPGLDPAYAASPYTYGTLQQFRDGMNLLRLLGLSATYWSQWYYRGTYCPGSTYGTTPELSHFASTWPCSAFFKDHPDWAWTAADGTRNVNYQAPGIFDWMKSWTQQYWLGYGMQGRFLDVNAQIPYVYGPEAPLFLDFYVWTLRQGGYIESEKPEAFLGPLYDNDANPYTLSGREWGMPFASGAVRDRSCLGIPGTSGYTACQAALASSGPYPGTDYDVAAARRVHAIGGALGMAVTGGPSGRLARMQTFGQSYIDAIKAESLHFGNMQDRFGVPDRVELINPAPQPMAAGTVTLATPLGASDTTLYALPVYQLPQTGQVQIDGEIIAYTSNDSDSGLNMGLSTLSGLSRGQNGTTPAAHSAGASIVPLNDPLHWTYDDAYWVYGQAPNEVWVKYSDGSVWQQGGTTPASLPQITGVQVIPNGTTATVTWTTNVAAACWVDYDTYGAAEAYNGQRPASWWPNYLQHTNLNDPGAPAAATSHSRTLTGLTPGATYHYRVVCRGPAPAVTADATFVAGGAGPTPTVPPAATPTRTPSRAATPAATGTATATPPASPTSAATSSSTPAVTATPAAGWISVSPTTVSQNASITVQWGNFTAHDSGSYWFMYRTG